MTERPPQPRPTITVWQPYASLIMHGIKTFEARPSEPGGSPCHADVLLELANTGDPA